MSDESKVRDVVEAVKGVVEAVPIYDDALKPAAKEVGKSLETVAKIINVALLPLKGLVWGTEHLQSFFENVLSEKLRNVPPERIQTPPLHVAGPALESLRFTGNTPELREMYANLLANAMDAATVMKAHPAFVEVIRNLTPDEAKMVKAFLKEKWTTIVDATLYNKETMPWQSLGDVRNISWVALDAQCQNPKLAPSYLGNLSRLGLIQIRGTWTVQPQDRIRWEKHPDIMPLHEKCQGNPSREIHFLRKVANVTDFGELFVAACVLDKGQLSAS